MERPWSHLNPLVLMLDEARGLLSRFFPPFSCLIFPRMSLPDLVEIVPLSEPVRAEITVPGSKSITNRALILAALAEGETTLQGALWSEDTEVMVECLQDLGFMVNVAPDAQETCNRAITVYGMGGKVPRGGTAQQPLELFVGNAGTAARFLAAMVCLGEGVYRLHGAPRMHERPQAALFQALRELGYQIDSANDKLPALIHGGGPRPGKCKVSIEESSQFASALLLSARVGGWNVELTGENAEESPYVVMTSRLIEAFPRSQGTYQIEPDASSGGYFLAASWLLTAPRPVVEEENENGTSFFMPPTPPRSARFVVQIRSWPNSGWQVDSQFPNLLPLPRIISRERHLGDSILTAITLAAESGSTSDFAETCVTAEHESEIRRGIRAQLPPDAQLAAWFEFKNLGRLRQQECERVEAIRTELSKCGARILEKRDTVMVLPSALHGAEIETYNDHRMAMCFAILGLKVPGIRIKNPSCVKKTFPNFFQKLAAPPPAGLGASILDARSGRRLPVDELFAESE